jgi:hypothetical protein
MLYALSSAVADGAKDFVPASISVLVLLSHQLGRFSGLARAPGKPADCHPSIKYNVTSRSVIPYKGFFCFLLNIHFEGETTCQ